MRINLREKGKTHMSYYDGMMGGYGYNSNSGMNNYPNNRPPQQRMMPQIMV